MTKVTILGKEPQKKELKKIEFIRHYDSKSYCENYNPSRYDNIILIKSRIKEENGLDLMCCFDDAVRHDSSNRALILGHFNDGIV